jgi:hypothetical protein
MSAIQLPWFGADDITRLLSSRAATAAIRGALRAGLDPASDPARGVVDLRSGQLLLMPSQTQSFAGVKVATVPRATPIAACPGSFRLCGRSILFGRWFARCLRRCGPRSWQTCGRPPAAAMQTDRVTTQDGGRLHHARLPARAAQRRSWLLAGSSSKAFSANFAAGRILLRRLQRSAQRVVGSACRARRRCGQDDRSCAHDRWPRKRARCGRAVPRASW